MLKISAVIITLNEEKDIGRCLRSLEGVADEIIVIDSYSTDKTAEICKASGATFILNPFEGHIEQKNYAVEQAKYPLVLSLDADEAISEELRASILEVKQNKSHDAYQFNRLNNYCGEWVKYAGWYPDTKIRLWDKNQGKWGGTNPHDKVIMSKGTSVGFLKGDLLHYSYSSLSQYTAQTNSFSTIAARESFRQGKKPSFTKIVLNPFYTFIKKYFFQLGFMGGWTGFIICINSAYGKFLKYAKLQELYKNNRH